MQTDDLTLKAALLARTAPEQWAEFLKSFADYRDTHREKLVKSPLDALQVCQGQAQALGSLHDILKTAVANAEKIAGKANR